MSLYFTIYLIQRNLNYFKLFIHFSEVYFFYRKYNLEYLILVALLIICINLWSLLLDLTNTTTSPTSNYKGLKILSYDELINSLYFEINRFPLNLNTVLTHKCSVIVHTLLFTKFSAKNLFLNYNVRWCNLIIFILNQWISIDVKYWNKLTILFTADLESAGYSLFAGKVSKSI